MCLYDVTRWQPMPQLNVPFTSTCSVGRQRQSLVGKLSPNDGAWGQHRPRKVRCTARRYIYARDAVFRNRSPIGHGALASDKSLPTTTRQNAKMSASWCSVNAQRRILRPYTRSPSSCPICSKTSRRNARLPAELTTGRATNRPHTTPCCGSLCN